MDKTKAGCVLALLGFAGAAIAQGTAAPSEKSPKITYAGGQLSIHALDSTLAEILTKVTALTGVSIDVPAGANTVRLPIVELGPGPARQILATLLGDSDFDFLIQASDADPQKVQRVMLMVREKKGRETADPPAPPRSRYARAVTPEPQEAPPADNNPPPVVAETTDTSSSNPPQPGPTPPVPPSPPAQTNPMTRTAPLSPPATLNSESINQQLQQMYQQRIQMNQQSRQGVPPPAPVNSGNQ